jgi:ATP-dependent Clp protease ATP-binding subunit ClpX
MGFGADIKSKKEQSKQNPLEKALPEDIIKFGMIPEFVGRLAVMASLEQLDEESLVRILKEPKNSLVRQYQTMFEFEDVELRFSDEALKAVAKEALKRNVGARGLRIILEELMLDLMYTIPSQREIQECVITEDTVVRRSQPVTTLRKAG